MPNDKHLPLCPYYKRHMSRSITCEDVCRTFSDSDKKELWLRTYCDTPAWEKCEYAQSLTKAYERLFKGDDKAIMENEYESLKREIKKLSTLLGKSEKRVERQQKKIDELRAINQSFVKKNEDLYKKWRDVNETMEAYEESVAGQVQVIIDSYEVRLAYLVDKYGPFSDIDVDEWRKDKAFALVYDKNDDGYPCWQVRFGEVEENEDGEHDAEGISGDNRQQA